MSEEQEKLNPDAMTEEVSSQLSQRVKTLRAERGWSLESLSAACGVSRSMLSQIERDQANPTLAVTMRIAQAFGLSIGELIETPQASANIQVIRSGDRKFLYRSDGECQIRTLSPLHLEKDVEFYEVLFPVGGKLVSAAHFKGTREFLTVQKGKIELTSDEENVTLSKGDSASYRADVPHSLENVSRGEALIFLVDIYQNG